jgi:carboxyl-terminal processing protease
MNFKQSFLFTALCAVVITAAFLAGYFTHTSQTSSLELPVLEQAYHILLKHGLDVPTEGSTLEYGMIRGMIQAYGDPYTSFNEPVQAELSSNMLQGSYGGIGVSLGKDAEGFHVLYPFPDGPAARAGIKDGDRLVKVNTLDITIDTTSEVLMAAVRGPVGESIEITVTRPPDYNTLIFKIERAEIALPSVTWHLESSEKRLGIIKVNIIAATTPDEIQKGIKDNFGGLLDSGVDVAKLFLKKSVVIEQQYRDQPVEQYQATKAGPLYSLPLIVLVNQNTASAAEIISGALQAQHRAKLIGVPTYGKNTIQLVFQLLDGSSFNVTSAHWWVPGLDTPRPGQGIQPDILLSQTEGTPDPFIQAAIDELFLK